MDLLQRYFVSINDLVIEQCADEIAALSIPKFIAWHSHRHFKTFPDELMFLYTTFTGPKFAHDMTRRVWEGATVTNVALQLAFYMGFEKVILIGVDHNFTSKGEANKTVVSTGDDPNHFSANYFGKGFRWQLPDLDTSEIGYQKARDCLSQSRTRSPRRHCRRQADGLPKSGLQFTLLKFAYHGF